jgi:hypothetical protein
MDCFSNTGGPLAIRFNKNWGTVQAILAKRKKASTHQELLMNWPADQDRPSTSMLYRWLNRAFDEKRLRRQGSGRRDDPYRYRLENEADQYWDRGKLPPMPELPPMIALRLSLSLFAERNATILQTETRSYPKFILLADQPNCRRGDAVLVPARQSQRHTVESGV